MRIIGFRTARTRHFRPYFRDPGITETAQRLKSAEKKDQNPRDVQRSGKMNRRWRRKDEKLKRASQNKMIIYLVLIIALIYIIFFAKIF